MADNDKKPKEGTTQTALDTPEQEPTSVMDALDKARLVLAELKMANEEKKKLLDREEKLRLDQLVAGRAMAGQPPQQPVVESPADYAKRILRGGK